MAKTLNLICFRSFLLLALSITGNMVYAQPSNDEPCDAIPLSVGPSCSYQTYTVSGATASAGVTAPGCANYQGGDVWFTVTVPCEGSIIIDTDDGQVTDAGMAVYSGDCAGGLTLIDCDDDGSSNGLMPYITLTGQPAGSTIYIRIWEYGNDNQGDFSICITTPPPPGPGGSCLTAQPFCTSNQYTFPNTTGVPDAGGGGIYGCLFTIPNPVWYYMQVATPGTIEITIEQTSTSGAGIDVDYVVWGPFSSLQISCPGLSATNIVSCSYSIAPIEVATIPNTQVGEFYVMLITNYNGAAGTITFQQTAGTGATTCAIICDVTASNSGPVCPGGTFNLNASTILNATYSWTGPNCYTSTQQNPTGLTAPTMPGTYTYTVTATTPAGTSCSASTTVVVGSNTAATAATTPPSCTGATDGTIVVTPQTPGSYTYTLTPGNITNTTGTFNNLPTGSYSVTYSDATGCSGIINNISIPQGTALSGNASPTNTSCSGVNDGSIVITPSVAGTYSYTLTPGNITNTTGIFNNLAPGSYAVTFTNAQNCTGTVNNIPIASGPPLTGTASATATSCPTVNDGTITVTPGGTGPYTFTLNPGNVVQASNVFTNLAPGTYTITFATLSGCNGTVTTNPVVNPGPALTSSATTDNPDCFGINDGSVTIVPGGTAPFNFTLTGPGGPYNQTTATFTGLAPGTYNYTYTDAAGCQGSGTATLTTNPPINTPATLVMPLCNGGNDGSITVTPNGGVAPYQFSINGGTTYQSSGTINGLSAGSHTIRVRDNLGCIKDTTVMLGEPALLTASASSVNAGCAGNDGTITVTGSGGTPPYQYSVDNGTNYQPSALFTVSVGDYNNIRVKDANGCVANAAVSVGLTDNMFLDLGPDVTICAEASHTFQPQTNTETNVFAWSSSSFTPSTLDDATIKNATASPLSTTTYVLNATWGACSRTDDITVNVLRKPVPNAGADVMICHMDSALLAASATNLSGTVNYVWAPAAYVREDSSATTWAVPDTTMLFIVTVTDNYGCNFSVQDSVLVTMQPPVPAYAGNDTIAILGVPHQLTASGGSTYTWSPSAPLDNPFSPTPMATLSNDTKFTVVINDIAGCVGYDTVFVKVYEGPTYYVPNAFSPNGDGLNDIFRAIPVGIAKTEWFRVFNRYGQVVFETNQWLKGWDGNFMGKQQPMGVYIWIVKGTDRRGRTVEQKGTVMLVR